jgi:hypothetical protein
VRSASGAGGEVGIGIGVKRRRGSGSAQAGGDVVGVVLELVQALLPLCQTAAMVVVRAERVMSGPGLARWEHDRFE